MTIGGESFWFSPQFSAMFQNVSSLSIVSLRFLRKDCINAEIFKENAVCFYILA